MTLKSTAILHRICRGGLPGNLYQRDYQCSAEGELVNSPPQSGAWKSGKRCLLSTFPRSGEASICHAAGAGCLYLSYECGGSVL